VADTAAFDVLILGGGSGGYAAAFRASELGLSVALIEKDKVGGTCLHYGCIPTKALLHAAEVADQSRESEQFGVKTSFEGIDMPGVNAYKDGIVARLRDSGADVLLFTLPDPVPINPLAGRAAARLVRLNEALRDISARRGTFLVELDRHLGARPGLGELDRARCCGCQPVVQGGRRASQGPERAEAVHERGGPVQRRVRRVDDSADHGEGATRRRVGEPGRLHVDGQRPGSGELGAAVTVDDRRTGEDRADMDAQARPPQRGCQRCRARHRYRFDPVASHLVRDHQVAGSHPGVERSRHPHDEDGPGTARGDPVRGGTRAVGAETRAEDPDGAGSPADGDALRQQGGADDGAPHRSAPR